MIEGLTLDQLAVFRMVAEEGGFSAAARRLNRAQSAVTYAIQNLEAQTGLTLFDRTAYRPSLSQAGAALLPHARRILDDVAAYRDQARSIGSGCEAKLTLVVEVATPPGIYCGALKAFDAAFPQVEIDVRVKPLDAAIKALTEEGGDLGVLTDVAALVSDFERSRCGWLGLVVVAAPEHPLAALAAPLERRALNDHTQIVLTSGLEARAGREWGVHAVHRWRTDDLNAKHRLLLAGVGWGSMPRPWVADDLAAGRLVELRLDRWDGADHMPEFGVVVAHRKDHALGPAGRWLRDRLRDVGLGTVEAAPVEAAQAVAP